MSVEDFKHQFMNELVGLTAARVTTLWKKSKTMSHTEILEAITQSKMAQTRDQQRRLKTVEITDQIPSTQPVEQPVPVPVHVPISEPSLAPKQEPEPTPGPVLVLEPVSVPAPEQTDTLPIPHPSKRSNIPNLPKCVGDASIRAMPDWSQECRRANIDLIQLKSAVNYLCSKIESQVSSTNSPSEMRILSLYQSVEDLLLLRVKRGNMIDVLSILQ